jgi:hypothetical protein
MVKIYTIWRAYKNQYWPAHYFIDKNGRVRHHHFGEGKYEESEKVIQDLLGEKEGAPADFVKVTGEGAQAPTNTKIIKSRETYLGYSRAENMQVTPAVVMDAEANYKLSKDLALNEWGLTGNWVIGKQEATLKKAGGKITYRFQARDVHLVLGPSKAGKTIRFKVTVDGKAPGKMHGMDINEEGIGKVEKNRLYQLIRQDSAPSYEEKTFEIEFLDNEVQAFAFTFG